MGSSNMSEHLRRIVRMLCERGFPAQPPTVSNGVAVPDGQMGDPKA